MGTVHRYVTWVRNIGTVHGNGTHAQYMGEVRYMIDGKVITFHTILTIR